MLHNFLLFFYRPKKDRKCEKCGMRRTGPLAQQQPDKLCGSCRITKNSGPYQLLQLFFDCHNFLPFEKDMILLEKQTGLQKLQIINWFTEQIQQVNVKSGDLTKGGLISESFWLRLKSPKKRCEITPLSIFSSYILYNMDNALGHKLAPFLKIWAKVENFLRLSHL